MFFGLQKPFRKGEYILDFVPQTINNGTSIFMTASLSLEAFGREVQPMTSDQAAQFESRLPVEPGSFRRVIRMLLVAGRMSEAHEVVRSLQQRPSEHIATA